MNGKNLGRMPNTGLLVAPSILAADFAALGAGLDEIQTGGADMVHLDIMDGHFVPNISFGPPVIASLRKLSEMIFDAHLMISEPLKYISTFAEAGANHITFHIESEGEPREIISTIKKHGMTAGVTLKPGTPVAEIESLLPELSMVLVMTVEPGFGGQSFINDMMPKVRRLRRLISAAGLPTHIQVDGGIAADTAAVAASAGANVMVAGTAVFRAPEGIAAAIAGLKKAVVANGV